MLGQTRFQVLLPGRLVQRCHGWQAALVCRPHFLSLAHVQERGAGFPGVPALIEPVSKLVKLVLELGENVQLRLLEAAEPGLEDFLEVFQTNVLLVEVCLDSLSEGTPGTQQHMYP